MPEPATADTRPAIAAAVIVHNQRVLLVQRKVSEGSLSWQFPAGQVEDGETPGQAAVRETLEETGLTVTEGEPLGERVHPNTGRTMAYVACGMVGGEAHVADEDELAAVEWVEHEQLADLVPYGFYEPVQEHLTHHMVVIYGKAGTGKSSLPRSPSPAADTDEGGG